MTSVLRLAVAPGAARYTGETSGGADGAGAFGGGRGVGVEAASRGGPWPESRSPTSLPVILALPPLLCAAGVVRLGARRMPDLTPGTLPP